MALPSPSTITPTSRYILAGTRRYTWVPTISNKNAPTSAELTAGTDLTFEVASVSGFATTSATVDAPDTGSRFVSKTAGRITADNSSLTVYLNSTGTSDVRTLLTRDLTGFVVIYPEGIGASKTCDIFPVKVIGVPKSQDIEGNATVEVQFVVTSTPVENLAIPTV
jgi:hypothetical protein